VCVFACVCQSRASVCVHACEYVSAFVRASARARLCERTSLACVREWVSMCEMNVCVNICTYQIWAGYD